MFVKRIYNLYKLYLEFKKCHYFFFFVFKIKYNSFLKPNFNRIEWKVEKEEYRQQEAL